MRLAAGFVDGAHPAQHLEVRHLVMIQPIYGFRPALRRAVADTPVIGRYGIRGIDLEQPS
jgi:hypothetical protein